jgi:hypothetical protein
MTSLLDSKAPKKSTLLGLPLRTFRIWTSLTTSSMAC